jgi:hypothetical protein
MRLLILVLVGFVFSVQAGMPVLYLYGDVSDDGNIPSGKNEPYHQMRLIDTGSRGMSEFKEAVDEAGFTLSEKYDAAIELNEDLLNQYRVIIFGSNQRVFTKHEAESVAKWVKQGGGLIAWSDSAFGGHYRKVGVSNPTGRISNNIITEQFGMHFLTDNGGGNYLISSYTEDHYLNNNNRDGGIRYRGEGVSCVRVSAPARMLAPLQEGGLGGLLTVNKNDGTYNPKTDAALAVAEIGKGRVIGTFDRNCFWNAGEGTRLSHVDNREFAQRLVVWAAGLETESKISRRPLPKSGVHNQPPKVDAGPDQTVTKLQADLSGIVIDDGLLGKVPNMKWKQQKGPGKVRFENNNPNTANVRVFFSKPGKYLFYLVVDDGEFSIRDKVTITVNP